MSYDWQSHTATICQHHTHDPSIQKCEANANPPGWYAPIMPHTKSHCLHHISLPRGKPSHCQEFVKEEAPRHNLLADSVPCGHSRQVRHLLPLQIPSFCTPDHGLNTSVLAATASAPPSRPNPKDDVDRSGKEDDEQPVEGTGRGPEAEGRGRDRPTREAHLLTPVGRRREAFTGEASAVVRAAPRNRKEGAGADRLAGLVASPPEGSRSTHEPIRKSPPEGRPRGEGARPRADQP
mmetsp:Transcript_62328/g.184438  ORF Transcript_62328/g.184438 Transcript_62328/m.184438 type:complete len:236 (-) Transcript_62328:583-1290(-)